VLLTITISLAALLGLAGLFSFTASRRDAKAFPPPGRLIDVAAGRRLHARVEGQGVPAVVFEAGISASSVNWIAIRSQITAFTACVSYDRAGLGWSDPHRGVFDVERMLADLGALLDRLDIPGPFVLVGHSYGGLLVRLFAERYPSRVAGLVLVDPVLACSWAHPDVVKLRVKRRAERIARWGVWFARFGVVRLATSPILVRSLVKRRRADNGVVSCLQTELVKLPPDTLPLIRSHWCRSQNFRSMTAHLTAVEPSFAALKDLPAEYPMTVISAGNTPPEGLAEHRAVADLSRHGRHIVARHSEHWIQFDEPDLVVEAIRAVVEDSRTGD